MHDQTYFRKNNCKMKRIILSLLFVVCQLLICQAQSSDHKTMVSTYRLAGPYEVVARDGEFRKSKAGSKRDMWQAMVRRAILPVVDKFEANSPYANGNWGHIVDRITQVKVGWNQKYCTAAGAGVENVLFRNIRYYGAQPNMSVITGYDSQHKVKNVTFEGLKINGKAIYDDMSGKPKWYSTADFVPMFVGSHVENLKFNK